MRVFFTILTLFWLSAGAAFGQAANDPQVMADLHFGQVLQRMGANEEARDRLTSAMMSPWLTRNERGTAHLYRGRAFWALGDRRMARADFDQAVELLVDPGEALMDRARLTWVTGDRDQSLDDMLRIARGFPDDLKNIDVNLFWAQWNRLDRQGRSAEQADLVETFIKADYRPNGFAILADGLKQQYVRILIDRGEIEKAKRWAMKITVAALLSEMRFNGRFRPLWDDPAFKAYSGPLAAAERELAHLEELSRQYPKDLELVLYRMQALRMLGRSEEAMRTGGTVRQNPGDYEDNPEYRAWVLNEEAYALKDMGRMGDAIALMASLFERSAREEPYLLNQFINLGTLLLYAGEPARALESVARAEVAGKWITSYGRKWIESIRVCAFHRLGRAADMEAALKRLRTNPDENYPALSRALLCLSRLDEAVALTLTRLRHPHHRNLALGHLQNFREHGTLSPLVRKMRTRWEAVRTHPEVVAEARKHGRLLDIPLYPTYWGDV